MRRLAYVGKVGPAFRSRAAFDFAQIKPGAIRLVRADVSDPISELSSSSACHRCGGAGGTLIREWLEWDSGPIEMRQRRIACPDCFYEPERNIQCPF